MPVAYGVESFATEENKFPNSNCDLNPMKPSLSGYELSDTIVDAGAPYFYRVASYIQYPFALNIYSDQIYTKAVGVSIDSFAPFFGWPNPWTPRLELATINNRDYLFLPSLISTAPLAIWDVTDLTNRQKVGEISSYPIDVAVKDTFCFTVRPWGPLEEWISLSIFNVSDPTNPIYVGWLIIYNFYPLKIEVGNQRLFIFCAGTGYYDEYRYIIKIDVSDPTNPIQEEVTQVSDDYHKANDMIVSEPYVYVSRRHSGLRIYECEDLDYVAQYPYPPVDTLTYHSIDYQNGMIYAAKKSQDGSHIFLDIVDVSNPQQSNLVMSRYIGDLLSEPPGFLYVQGNYLYLTTWLKLSIYDISDSLKYVDRLIPGYDWWPGGGPMPFVETGEVIAKQDKVFGIIAQGACDEGHQNCFSGFYTAQTFGLETEVVLIGDVNADGSINSGDVIALANYLMGGGPRPWPFSLGEVNGDGNINIGDLIYLVNYLFGGGDPPTKIYVGPSKYQASLGLAKFEATTGNTFNLPIIFEANGPVAGVEIHMDYDPNEIELLPPVLTNNTQNLDLFYTKDWKKIFIVDLKGKNLVPKGQILNLRVINKTLSDSRDSKIRISEALVFDRQGRELKVEILNSVVGSSEPKEFQLCQNYPNPFNPTTVIGYSLPSDCRVNLTIYNVLGQKVRTLIDEYQKSGYQRISWDGKNDQGKEVASGIYFYRLKAGDFTQRRKMVMIK